MNTVETTLEYIVDDPRFAKERPFVVLLGPSDQRFEPNDPKLCTIRWSDKSTTIHDGRLLDDVNINTQGFQIVNCNFQPFSLDDINTVQNYQRETEQFLKDVFAAEAVLCYDFRVRKNKYPIPDKGSTFDINDPSLIEQPPNGAHIDVTRDSGPGIIKRLLPKHGLRHLLKPGYRYRIVNTWRPLVPKLEDRPLAVCDFRTVNPGDLLASDRIYPHLQAELYYLKHNPNQRWYWLPGQTPNECMLMLMYDTKPGTGARYCPHVSFENPRASPSAPPRESVETRSIVITKVD